MIDINIGLVLSGGASRGAHQAGYLKAILEHVEIKQIKAVSSSSIGCLNAYALLSGKHDFLESIWKSLDVKNILNLLKIVRKMNLIEKYVEQLISDDDYLEPLLYVTTSQIPKPTVCYWKLQGCYNMRWRVLLRRAVGFPFIAKMQKENGAYHLDGGFFDNIPAYPMQYQDDIDILLILHSDPGYRPDISLFGNERVVLDIMQDAETALNYSHFNFRKNALNIGYEEGYANGKELMHKLFDGIRDKRDLRNNAYKIYTEELEKRKKLSSMGTIVTKINNLFGNLYQET